MKIIIINSVQQIDSFIHIMKEPNLLQDSLSFGTALQKKPTRKPPSSIFKSSSKTSFNQLSSNLPSPRCIQRTNITLANLFKQYNKFPNNQYNLKLAPSNQDIKVKPQFDLWISSFQQSAIAEKQENSMMMLVKNKDEELSFIDSFNQQNNDGILQEEQVEVGMMKKKITQTTEELSSSESLLDKQIVKYSFSQYYEPNQQNSDNNNRKESQTKQQKLQSIINNNNNDKNSSMMIKTDDYDMKLHQKTKIKKIKQQIKSISKRMMMKAQHFQNQYYKIQTDNKQNQDTNMVQNENRKISKVSIQKQEIKGLQFSKNKRFKSSKKMKTQLTIKTE